MRVEARKREETFRRSRVPATGDPPSFGDASLHPLLGGLTSEPRAQALFWFHPSRSLLEELPLPSALDPGSDVLHSGLPPVFINPLSFPLGPSPLRVSLGVSPWDSLWFEVPIGLPPGRPEEHPMQAAAFPRPRHIV